MRVISQDGKMDIPYKECIFQVYKNEVWCLNTAITIDEDGWKIAIYSTEEKALKALEMCRETYKKYKIYYSLIVGNMNETIEIDDYEDIEDSVFFQFPKDKEEGE